MGNNFTPAWIKKGFFNESLFCDDFLSTHQPLYSNGAFFTPEGRVTDTMNLRCEIFDMLRDHIGANIAKRVSNVVDVLKLAAQVEDFPLVTDRIALANGTLYLDGTFQEGKPEIVRNRLPVRYDPKAPQPTHWLRFLSDLLYPEDIPIVQEFIGYCLIPSNKGQRMMVIKGSGGEGKSQIGVVLSRLFGCNMKDGSIGKISENRFARADLEHTLLCVDDDMRMEALRQTNYVKSIVTAQGQMDLERKGKQSYQGWMYARLLAFSNGDLQALYDRSDGFYRRQLILTTKDKPLSRVDDPDIAEKMAAEVEGILLWAFEGLQRLVKNGFQFTESDRAKRNRELVKRDNNNVFDFLESEGYIRLKADACTSSKELYAADGRGTISVNKTMQRANKDALEKLDPKQVYYTFPDRREGSKSSLILKKPKTKKSNRVLYMTKPLKEELLAWLEKLKRDEQNAPEKYSNCGQLFRLPDGLPIAPELLTKWYRLWRAEHPEFEQIVFHGLRHSSATYQLLQSDGDFKSVQGNTGHATAAVLMDTYAHTQDKPRLELTEKIEANFYSQDLTPAAPQPRQNEKPAATKISGKEILEAIRLMDADERRELTRALFA